MSVLGFAIRAAACFAVAGIFCTASLAAECARPTTGCAQVASLLAQREGYGRFASGGLGGRFATVTSSEDDGPGTLRDLAENATEPTWIVFSADMTIALKSQLMVAPNVTIDGRGHSVVVQDFGFSIDGSYNVILTHLTVDGRFRFESQAVNVLGEAHDIWLDHLTLSRTNDRLVNVKNGSTDVTLSWIRFEKHNKVMLFNNLTDENLFGNYERDAGLRVTLHHSYFIDTVQRHPRAQIGTSHIYNNLLENWDYYGMSFSLEAKALIEGNIFSNVAKRPCTEPDHFDTIEKIQTNYCKDIPGAPARTALPNGSIDKKQYDKGLAKFHYQRDYRAFLRVRDNLYLGDAREVLADYLPERVPVPPYCYSYDEPTEALAAKIRAEAGNTRANSSEKATKCPATVEAAPRAHRVAWAWRNYSEKVATFERKGPNAFVVRESDSSAAQRGALEYLYGRADRRWRIGVVFRPIDGRGIAISITNAKAQHDPLVAGCTATGAKILSSKRREGASASVSPMDGGYFKCTLEGTPSAQVGNRVRLDITTSDGNAVQVPGVPQAGIEVKDVTVEPAAD